MCILENAHVHAECTHLPVWVGLKDRDSVSFNRWLQGLGQRASMDSKPTTAAKAERTEM